MSDASLYGPQKDIRQTAHAQEMKAVAILVKTFGISRSQAALLVRQQQDANARARTPENPNEGNKTGPLFQDLPRPQRGESAVEIVKTSIVPRPQEALMLPQLPNIPEAPEDHLVYGRKDAIWVHAVEEALDDLFVYGRSALGWVIVPPEAPGDHVTYARKDGAWLAIVSFPDVVASGHYWRTNAGWLADTVDEAPNDGQTYGRKSIGWDALVLFVDTGIDGKNYWRRDNTWVEDPIDEPASDGLYRARKNASWATFIPFTDAASDTTFYARKDGAWATFTPFTEAPNDIGYYARHALGWSDILSNLVSAATVDSTTTLSPGSAATASASFSSSTVHFTFGIPKGDPGVDGSDPTDAHLNSLITALFGSPLDYALNPTTVAELGMTVSNPPTQAEVQTIADKIDELIDALKH